MICLPLLAPFTVTRAQPRLLSDSRKQQSQTCVVLVAILPIKAMALVFRKKKGLIRSTAQEPCHPPAIGHGRKRSISMSPLHHARNCARQNRILNRVLAVTWFTIAISQSGEQVLSRAKRALASVNGCGRVRNSPLGGPRKTPPRGDRADGASRF